MKRTSSRELLNYLISMDIPSNRTYIIHSSLVSLGIIEGGCKGVMECLHYVLGNKATILMPSFTLSYAEKKYWDSNSTKSESGALTEYFRNLSHTVRTVHPFHSVSVSGPNSKLYTSCTNLSSFGPNNPFEVLIRENAINIGLGVGLVGGATFLHYAEELARVPYRYNKKFPGTVIDKDNNLQKECYSMYVRQKNIQYDYVNEWKYAIEDLLNEKIYKKKIFNGVEVFTMSTKKAHQYFLNKIIQNPYYCAKKKLKD